MRNYVPEDSFALTLMVGPSGAGKSTALAKRASDMRGVVLSTDETRARMCGDFRDQSQNGRVFAHIYAQAAAYIERGVPVVIDATHLKREERMNAIACAPENARIRYVVVDRPLEEKLLTGGWRLGVVIDGETLVECHHRLFRSALPDILNGDGLDRVEVVDLRT